MNKEIFMNLMNNRMLRDNNEIEGYERNLETLAGSFSEEDIIELCLTFDDKTQSAEIMYSAIHLLETLSSKLAFEKTIIGVVRMFETSPDWVSIITYRCLNDEFSVQMIKDVCRDLDEKTCLEYKRILQKIKNEDPEKFGIVIDDIVGSI